MKVAVIVVNYNDVEDTLKYVNKITEYKNIDRIVVVDNMSTIENTLERLKELANDKVLVISSDKNGGYSYGNNFGIRYLQERNEQYDCYIISNPDIEVSEEAIQKCIKELEDNVKTAVVAPRMVNSKGKNIRRSAWKFRTFGRDVVHSSRILEILLYKILRNGEYNEKDYENPRLKVDCISGAFFLIRKNVYDEIKGFDDNVFLFYEEDILGKQLAEKGYETISLNDISFKHYESQTIGKTFNYYNKIKKLYISKMYYHKEYTKLNKFQVLIFRLLRGIRIIELLVEIPLRKFLRK